MTKPIDAQNGILFQQLDLNDGKLDGTISKQNLIKEVDTNHDGKISRKEFDHFAFENKLQSETPQDAKVLRTLALDLKNDDPVRYTPHQLPFSADREGVQQAIKEGVQHQVGQGQALHVLNQMSFTKAKEIISQLTPDQKLELARGYFDSAGQITKPGLRKHLFLSLSQALLAQVMKGQHPYDAEVIAKVLEYSEGQAKTTLLNQAFASPKWDSSKAGVQVDADYQAYRPTFPFQQRLAKTLALKQDPEMKPAVLSKTLILLERAKEIGGTGERDLWGMNTPSVYRDDAINGRHYHTSPKKEEFQKRHGELLAYYGGHFPDKDVKTWVSITQGTITDAVTAAPLEMVQTLFYDKTSDAIANQKLLHNALAAILRPPNLINFEKLQATCLSLLEIAKDPAMGWGKDEPRVDETGQVLLNQREKAVVALGTLLGAAAAAANHKETPDTTTNALKMLIKKAVEFIPLVGKKIPDAVKEGALGRIFKGEKPDVTGEKLEKLINDLKLGLNVIDPSTRLAELYNLGLENFAQKTYKLPGK